jgi:hypothetical protein
MGKRVVMRKAIRAILFLAKVVFSILLLGIGYQVSANYRAGYSGPFKGLDLSAPNANKHVLLEAKLKEHFSTPLRLDLAHSYMESLGFKCNFLTGDAATSRLGKNEHGAILMCIYRFEGTLYLVPDNLIVLVYFDDNMMSYKLEYTISSI